MITAGVVTLVVLVVGAVMYRIGRNNGFSRGSDEGFQVGLERGRNEPLDKIQSELDKANADLKNARAAITAATSQVKALDRAAAEKRAELERDLERLEPIAIRLEQITKTRTTIAKLERQILDVERCMQQATDEIHQLQIQQSRSTYRGPDGRASLHGGQIEALYLINDNRSLRLDVLRADLNAANSTLVDLIDDLAVKRAELNV